MEINKLHEQAQYLAIEAQHIADSITDDAIPMSAIEENIEHLCYEYVKLRTDVGKAK